MLLGDLIMLLCGVMVLDFVYVVYISIGDICVGVKINGNYCLFSIFLKNGDIIEVLYFKG